MASRRNKNNKNSTKIKTAKKTYDALVASDVVCPICRGILLEPVRLPCEHVFCLSCFEGTMQNLQLVCPLCRVRIGSWLRRAKKESKLVDDEMWQAIKEKFSHQIKNKLNGIDEDLCEEPKVIVSYPGEIRKEYELQKQKEEKELRLQQEAEMKASEELINKIKEEEEYQKLVTKKKLKYDEQVAKQLAKELSIDSNPSTSKSNCTTVSNSAKKSGPLDKFLDKNQIKPMEDFANKEYTCRVLRLDNKKTQISIVARSQPHYPIIKKRMQQIQKITELDTNSDSSDCFESEMRYFKPINSNLPSQKTSPIKIVPMKPRAKNGTREIQSPTGLVNFHSDLLESAFARISLTLLPPTLIQEFPSLMETSPNKLKRSLSDDQIESPNKKFVTPNHVFNHKVLTADEIMIDFVNNGAVKNNNNNKELEERERQERQDLELARQLQKELNRASHNLRSDRRVVKKQSTLESMFKNSHRIKKVL